MEVEDDEEYSEEKGKFDLRKKLVNALEEIRKE
jgi:hypothetical protein